jgi:exonuclease SbcC
MKLKQLIIDNIASIEHAEINFDAAPLADEHLFLIAGETGAGKSTIIDCLCLALYGDTPRLNAAKSADYTTSREEGANEDNLKTDDVRQLLRRGAVSADVKLTFDDNDGTPYVATWHVHRSRNKADGAIQKPVRAIMTDDGVAQSRHYSKIREIDDFVMQTIGLDMNQFFRTVVLAQGKFAEFLESDDNDKAALLEKMTGTEIYAQIGKKIYETCKEKERERDLLRDQLQNIKLLSDEEKAQITDEIADFKKQSAIEQQQHDGAKKMTDWLGEKADNEKKLTDKRDILAGKMKQREHPEFLEQQTLINDWDASADARRELLSLRNAQRQIAALDEQRPALQQEFDRLCAALRATETDLSEKEKNLDEIRGFLQQQEPNREMYNAIGTIKSVMDSHKSASENITSYSQALEQELERLPKAEDALKRTLEESKKQEAAVEKLQQQYDDMHIEQIIIRKDNLFNAKQELNTYKGRLDDSAQAKNKLEELKEELKKQQTALEQEEAGINGKRKLEQKARAAVERQKDWNALINQAHKTLHEGDTCPVCGNVINTLLAPKAQSELEQLQQELQTAEQAVITAESSIKTARNLTERLQREIQDKDNDLKQKNEEGARHWKLIQELLAKCGKKTDEMVSSSHIEALIKDIDDDIERLNCTIKQAQDLNEQIKQQREESTLKVKAHNQAQIDLNNINASINKQREAIQASKDILDKATAELDKLFVFSDWQERAKNTDFIEKLENEASNYKGQENEAQQLNHAIALIKTHLPAMTAAKANIKGLTDNGQTTAIIPDNLSDLWNTLENKSLQWNTRLDAEQKNAQQAQQALDSCMANLPLLSIERLTALASHNEADITAIKQAHQTLAQDIAVMQGEMQALKTLHDEIVARKPDFIEENPERLADIIQATDKRIEALNNEVANRTAHLKNDEDNARLSGEKQQLLNQAEAVYCQWAEFSSLLGSADGKTLRKIAQSYLLGELLGSANGYLRQFNDRYELETNPGTLTILVRDLLQGDRTAVTTLSGGESFMVSLALALALSSMSGKVFNVDTIFIDEGFGSLSTGYLDNVMETLNRLYDMGGRRVGIISHVEMLKERITTQIQVERDPKDNTVSRVRVV